LVEKFIADEKWYTGGILGNILVERMIVATFLTISRR
jgi:hypothetical protein